MLPTKSQIRKSLAAMLLGVGLATALQVAADPAPRKQAAQKQVADTVIEFAPYVNVTVGKSTLLKLPAPAARISVASPAVADIRLINPREVYLLGKTIGSTNITLWSKSGRSTQVDVAVSADIASLKARLKEIMPEETGIDVHAASDTLVLTGTVADASRMEKAVALAEAYAGKKVLNFMRAPLQQTLPEAKAAEQTRLVEQIKVAEISAKLHDLFPDEKEVRVDAARDTLVLSGVVSDAVKLDRMVTLAEAYAGSNKVINFLSAGSAQQVMLEVKVAEVSKNLLDKLGAKFAMDRNNGSWTYSILSNFLSSPALAGLVGASKSATKSISLDAQKDDDIIKILAEPNIMAISGQEGSFLAGGSFFIPVAQGGLGGVTLEEREFGVGLRFTPTVLEGGRINLRVAPEVSELSGSQAFENGGVSALLPVITTRRAATTVQLHDGQSFAIAGLIKNNVTEQVSRFPVLGEIPILGALFRSSSFKRDKTELLFVITPRLVKPLPPDYALPTDSFKEPSRSEFFLEGKMEGKEPQPQPEETQTPAAAKEEPAPQPEGDTGFEMK